MRTARGYNPPPIGLTPGVPTVLSGSDLAAYFETRNLDFTGYDRNLYERTKILPEGSVQICVAAFFYARPEVQVSNQGCSFYYLAKNEPPLISQPACGASVPHREPTQLIFQWLPRSTASPNSAASTEYTLELFEVRVPGRNPNDIALSQPPVFRVTTSQSLYVYSVADPPLVQGLAYVWRVQARDSQGRDDFRNNGYSQVCTFTYGGWDDPAFAVGAVQRFRATGTAPQAGRMQWQADGNFDSYRVYYQKSGAEHGWAQTDSRDSVLTVNGLEADNEYQTRIQGVKNGTYGPYSEIVSFRTPKPRVVLCGAGGSDSLAKADVNRPLLDALSGDIIDVDGQQMQLLHIQNLGDGYYKGTGKMFVDLLGGLGFKTTFERIYIDADRIVGRGRINYVSRGVDNMVVKQVTNQKERQANRELERLQAANRERYRDTVFHQQVFAFLALVGQNVELKADGTVLITLTDAEGKNITSPQPAMSQALKDHPAKAMIIEDKNGDQWVITKEGKVEAVKGGGLAVGADGKLLNRQQLRQLDRMILAALRKYKKAIEDYQTANRPATAPAKSKGGPGDPNTDDYGYGILAELPLCLASHTDELEQIQAQLFTLVDSTGTDFSDFATIVKERITQGENATQEQVDAAVCATLVESRNSKIIETASIKTLEITASNKIKYVIYFTPAGRPIILPIEAKPDFSTSTNLPVALGCLVGFTLNGKYYGGTYKKFHNNKIRFQGYEFKAADGTIIRYYDRKMYLLISQIQESTNQPFLAEFSIPIVIGSPSTTGGIGIGLEEIVAGSGLRTGMIRATGIAIVGYLIVEMFSSPPNPTLYLGDGDMVLALPYDANVSAPTNVTDVPVVMPHKIPSDPGTCHVYVIWFLKVDGSAAVAKYGMTCQDDYANTSDCNPRPDKQVDKFNTDNTDPNIVRYYYNWIARNVSKDVSHLMEMGLTASYVIANGGDLPPKHKLPCFVRGGSDVWDKRKELAEKYIEKMVKKYGI